MTRWLVLLALLASGCAMEVASDPADTTDVEDRRPDGITLDGARHIEAPDPCDVGTVHVIDGHVVELPVFCRPEEIDKGDPPAVEAWSGQDRILPGEMMTGEAAEAR